MIPHLPLPSCCDMRWALHVLWDKPLTTGGIIASTGEVKVEKSPCPLPSARPAAWEERGDWRGEKGRRTRAAGFPGLA